MNIIAPILVFGFIGFGFYQYNFGWWKQHQRFSHNRPEPDLGAFSQGGATPNNDQEGREP